MTNSAKRMVAVVDDDFSIRESVASLVESAGHTATVFSSAEQFLQSAFFGEADCLITDVRMPGMDGIELLRCTKRQRPELPVIFITAHQDEATRQRAVDQSAVCFLYKPFHPADLLQAIQMAIGESPVDSEKGTP